MRSMKASTARRILTCLALLALVPASTAAAQSNLLANPGFDDDLSGWNVPSSDDSEIGWSSRDVAGSTASGSLRGRNVSDVVGDAVFLASQCVDVEPGETHTFGGWSFAPSGQDFIGAFFQLRFYPEPGCTGGRLHQEVVNTGSITGRWVETLEEAAAPADANSAALLLHLSQAGGGSVSDTEVFLDRMILVAESLDGCIPGPYTACVGGRFEITVDYDTALNGGTSGRGVAVPLASVGAERGAMFWFFSVGNPEMVIKLLDPCAFADHFWAFYAAVTNVGFEVTVVDTETDLVWTSRNPDLTPALPVQDTDAFPCSG